MKKFTTTFFLLMAMVLLLPTEVKAADYYLIGDFNNWNTTDKSYKFSVNGNTKTATATISAAAFSSNGTDNDGVYFAVNAIESSSNRWFLKPSNNQDVTVSGSYYISSDYNNSNNSLCFKNPATSSAETYTVTLDFNSTSDINKSTLTIKKSGGGGSETSTITFYVSTQNEPKIYTWDNNNTEYTGGWSGTKGSEITNFNNVKRERVIDTSNKYWDKITITNFTAPLKLILNTSGNDDKTGDITIENNKSYTFDGNKSYSSGNAPTIGGVTPGSSVKLHCSTPASMNGIELVSGANNIYTYTFNNPGEDVLFRINTGNDNAEFGAFQSEYTFRMGETYDVGGNLFSSSTSTNYFKIAKSDSYENYTITVDVSGKKVTVTGKVKIINGIDPNAYYLVSPELTGGKLLPSFKMIASRNRSQNGGNGQTSTKFFTINFKQDEIKTMTNEVKFHWYISKGDKSVTYRPYHDNNNNFKLGLEENVKDDDKPKYKGKNNNVKYQSYNESKTTDNSKTNVFEMSVNEGVSYTIFLNTDNAVTMNINKKSLSTDGKGKKDPNGYYLIGNFSNAKGSVNIDPAQSANRKKMTLYRYKDGFRYDESDKTVTDATADSLVYVVHVEKPADGWGDLYMDVATGTSINDYTTWVNNADAWNTVIRPQVSTDGVDGRALKGGLVEAESGVLMSLNPEVDGELYDSYDFSMNLTTSTYRLVFNPHLYIVGEAVSTLDGTKGKSFNLEQKIQLTYDNEEGCYKYAGDGSMLSFENGKQFRFVANGKTYKINYSENDNEPYSLNNGNYNADIVGDETQYRNVVKYHNDGSDSSENPGAEQSGNHNVTFALASGDYVLRFFLPQDNDPYYTITHEASLVIAPEEKVCSWGGAVNPTGRVILTDNETTGIRGFIFTVDGSKPELVDGALPENTESATGTNIVIYEWNKLGDKGNIPAITSTSGKKIMFGGKEISTAISESGNVILKAYAVITNPDNTSKYMVSGDMQTALYKFREGVIIEIPQFAGKFLRTYSSDKNIDLPTEEDADVKAYEAYRYIQPSDEDKAKNKHGLVLLRRIKYIPANEGVVLVGNGTTEDVYLANLKERTDGLVTDKEDLWWKADTYKNYKEWNKWNNYLVPTVTAVPNLGNAEVDANNNIIARYFGLGSFYETKEYKQNGDTYNYGDYIGFFRLTTDGRCGANKAYLRIPSATNSTYGYINFNGQWLDDQYDNPGNGTASFAKTALIFDDIDEVPTGITTVVTDENGVNDNAYYTLQGIKVAKPTQGLYIHNGKKVIIK